MSMTLRRYIGIATVEVNSRPTPAQYQCRTFVTTVVFTQARPAAVFNCFFPPHRFGPCAKEFRVSYYVRAQPARRAVFPFGMLAISTQQIFGLADIKQVLSQRNDYVNSKERCLHLAQALRLVINPPVGGLHH